MKTLPLAAGLLLVACSHGSATGAGADSGTGAGPGPGTGGSGGSGPYQSGTRIKARVLTTPDGAKMFEGWHDTERNEDCTFLYASDGQQRCMPWVSATGSVLLTSGGFSYLDAACTASPVATFAPNYVCQNLKYIIVASSTPIGCGVYGGSSYRVFPAVSQYTTDAGVSLYRTLSDGGCRNDLGLGDVPANTVIVNVGAELPATDFQAGSEAVE